MSDIIPSSPSNGQIVQVVGTGTTVARVIVSYLARYTAEVVAAGVTSIVFEIENAKVQVRIAKRQAQANFGIVVHEDLAIRFCRAIDRIENNPLIRDKIKEKTIRELEYELDELFKDIRVEAEKHRY